MKKSSMLISLFLFISLISFGRVNNEQVKKNINLISISQDENNNAIEFSYQVLNRASVKLVIYSENGDFMKSYDLGKKEASEYSLILDKSNFPEGNYFCIIEANDYLKAEYFEISSSNAVMEVDYTNNSLSINFNTNNTDFVLNIFSENADFSKQINVKGNTKKGIIKLETNNWKEGYYLIHLLEGDEILSQTIYIS